MMADTQTMASTVAGFFETHREAETAIDDLKAAGFKSSQIGLAASGNALPTSETGTGREYVQGSGATGNAQQGENFWGKVKDFFGGEGAEPYAGERSEGQLGTREITDETGSGYRSDDLHGSLSDLSVPKEHAAYFGNKLGASSQGFLVTVTAAERTAEARAILERNGADLGKDSANFAGTGTAAQRTGDTTGAQNLKLYGEVLRVHKDRISRGEVRLHKEVHTEMQTIQVPVTREELVIERVPVSGGTVSNVDAFADQDIRIPLSQEQASVEKQAVVREEVRVGKRDVTENQSFDEQVRSEELKVEDETTGTRR